MADESYRINGHIGATIVQDDKSSHAELTDAEITVTEYLDDPALENDERGIQLSADGDAGQSEFAQIDVFLPPEAIEKIAESAARFENDTAHGGDQQ